MSKKDLELYEDKYGEIPKNTYDRVLQLINKSKRMSLDTLNKMIKDILKIKMRNYQFIFYMIPKATPRARFSGRSGVFYVKDARFNNELFGKFINSNTEEFKVIDTPCEFYCDLYLPIPSSMNIYETILAELRLIRPMAKPDWDNAGKTYSDMIQTHIILDDSFIVESRVRKFYSSKPRIELMLKYMEDFDSEFNRKRVLKRK